MSKINLLPALALASSFLTACSTPSPIEIHVPTPVFPPAQYMNPCPSRPSDGTIGAELQRLDALVRCERGDKATIKAWADGFK